MTYVYGPHGRCGPFPTRAAAKRAARSFRRANHNGRGGVTQRPANIQVRYETEPASGGSGRYNG